ncbi:GNAT family N-acetyltransferase [Paenibacillus sp. 1P07SE]|uniref:GNAT family N-acetyltransferase n=1 Tax=Paenibacillus sp. 1P07SE TaxID=3132209 RepID=UPI0039A5903B
MKGRESETRAFQLPAVDFEDLRYLLEELTLDKVEVQNPYGGRALGKVEVDSAEGKVSMVLRSELYCHEASIYQSLIIDRIALAPERMGIGTRVVEWLKDYAQRKGFDRICIRNAHTDASVGLAHKLGFINVPVDVHLREMFSKEESSDFHLLISRC